MRVGAITLRRDAESIQTKSLISYCQEKLYLNRIKNPYRKPTQVDKRKYAKVNGLNLVKELGKSVAVSSQYGLPGSARIPGCNKRTSTDCLSKTQLCANS